jgi:large-conductance mechanosensitive channel
MNISFHDVWESIQGYIVYIVGITIALCIDTISAIVSYLIYIPTMGFGSVSTMSSTSSTEGIKAVDTVDFALRVVDGQLWIWNLSVNELLQFLILMATLIITMVKGVKDLKKMIEEFKAKKDPKLRSRRKED